MLEKFDKHGADAIKAEERKKKELEEANRKQKERAERERKKLEEEMRKSQEMGDVPSTITELTDEEAEKLQKELEAKAKGNTQEADTSKPEAMETEKCAEDEEEDEKGLLLCSLLIIELSNFQ